MHLSKHNPRETGASENATVEMLGTRLAALRAERELTITSLAALADVSPGLISQAERGYGNPSYTTLVKLADALEVPVATFFSGHVPVSRSGVVRADSRERIAVSSDDLVYELLTPTIQGRLGVYMLRVPPGWSNESQPLQHEGEECLIVTEGRVVVGVKGRLHELGVGDSITLEAIEPHWWHNPGKGTATILTAMTPPTA